MIEIALLMRVGQFQGQKITQIEYIREMKKYSDLYCKIFLDSSLNLSELIDILNEELGLVFSGRLARKNNAEVEIRENEDFDEVKCQDKSDGFLHFPHYIEVDPFSSQEQDLQIELVSSILETMWLSKVTAIASCDYEQELPKNGGYEGFKNIF